MVCTHRTRLPLLLVATGLLLAQGCAYLNVGNPLLPNARLTGQASPPLLDIKITYQQSTKQFTFQPTEPTFQLSSLPNDSTPGVTINRFSAEYTDNVGNSIDAIALAKSNLGISYYMAPANGTQGTSVSFPLPIENQNLEQYGLDHAYDLAGTVSINPFFPGTLACHVTVYGQDDNYNQVQVPIDVPIRIEAEITQ
ncbi:MAG TPA: hypothetical protein V6D47_16975 [Oscillatoriaceae cyanobacterium]